MKDIACNSIAESTGYPSHFGIEVNYILATVADI